MEENVREKLAKILSGMGGDKMRGQTSAISELLTSSQGKQLVESLSDEDKKNILNKFMSMDTKDINEKLKNVNPSAIGNLTADEIKKKLR